MILSTEVTCGSKWKQRLEKPIIINLMPEWQWLGISISLPNFIGLSIAQNINEFLTH